LTALQQPSHGLGLAVMTAVRASPGHPYEKQMSHQEPDPKRHLLTIGLEDYYQVGAFNTLIQRGQWYRFENRLEQSTLRTLALLDEYGIRATFFVLGWIARIAPELVRTVAERGHEIASRGYYHRGVRAMTPEEFRDDLIRAREALEHASGTRVVGFRVADSWFDRADLWALDVLASEGYEYDSSIAPLGREFAAEPWRRFVHSHLFGDRVLWEYPISATQVLGNLIPVAGGNYVRQLPHWFVSRAIAGWHKRYSAPLVFYFHTWELDPDQPKISAASWLARVRQYRHLDRMEGILRFYFERYRMTGISDHMGLSTVATLPATPRADLRRLTPDPGSIPVVVEGSPAGKPIPVSVVIPCFNEELILPYLSNTLTSVQESLGGQYDFRFIFVDDRSSDNTWAALNTIFGALPNFSFVRHDQNRGVAAAIMTGIRAATTEIVCSIDCDCTYDPHELGNMIPLLDDADLVTASPYHPQGTVRNVPGWRLFLSRRLSSAYRMVLGRSIHTWTSCFRVHRRSATVDIRLTRSGFLGVAETLATLVLRGSRVVEYPATLEVRMLGRSKMRILQTIVGHIRLLGSLAAKRMFGPRITRIQSGPPGSRPRVTPPPTRAVNTG
jgi:polysaccharide deacetylase family protein (PEP-CTERM system associated)